MQRFFRDIYFGMRTFLAGMKVTAVYFKNANLHPKETVTTIPYDGTATLAKEVKVAPSFRGHLTLDPASCIGCRSCVRACPIDCIWIDLEKNEAGKFHVSRFDVDQLKCMYCGLCTRACPTSGLKMTKDWWGATFHTDDGTNLHGQLRILGAGYYTPAQKLEVERKRQEIAAAKKKAAAAPAAAPAAEKKPDA